jgi:glyoxylase-like metal-dependent hydrolase (beta-lactamase superfamily II)
MTLRLTAFVDGPLDTNAYLVGDDVTLEAIVVDAPQGVTPDIDEAIRAGGFTVSRIVLTHAHWDHIADANQLRAATGARVLAHPLAAERLANPDPALELPFEIPAVTLDSTLDEGDTVPIGEHAFTVMHLPGHDPAHIALSSPADLLLFSGDIVFVGGHGRTDLPGADPEIMNQTLARVLTLAEDTTVYPGHGQPTKLGAEVTWMQALAQS